MRITETILAAAKCIPDRDMGPLEGTEAGSWSVGLWSNPRVRSAIDRRETAQWDGREETEVGNAYEGKPGSQGGKAMLLSHTQRLEPTLYPLPTHHHWQLKNRERPQPEEPFKSLMCLTE